MKTTLSLYTTEEEEEEREKNYFNDLCNYTKNYILNLCCYNLENIKLISKEWYNLVNDTNTTDWYKLSFNLLTDERAVELMKLISYKEYIHDIYNILSSPSSYDDESNKEFRSHVGRIILYETNFMDILENDIKGTPKQNRVKRLKYLAHYIKSNRYNKLTFKNFHYRDIYCFLESEHHVYNLLLLDKKSQSLEEYFSSTNIDDNDDDMTHTDIRDILLFDEKSMLYFVNDKHRLSYISSITRFIESLYPRFNSDIIIDEMMERRSKWKSQKDNEYFGMTKEEIKKKWEISNTKAALRGTIVHQMIEDYYTLTDERKKYLKDKAYKEGVEEEEEEEEYSKEFNELFYNFEKDFVKGKLIPYRSEWVISDEELQLCGSVDMLYEYIDDTNTISSDITINSDNITKKKRLLLIDWKTCENVIFFATEGGNKECTKTTGNCNDMHQKIQLLLYKYILEKNYDKMIVEMYTPILNANQDNYKLIEIKWDIDAQKLINGIISYRKEYLKNKN